MGLVNDRVNYLNNKENNKPDFKRLYSEKVEIIPKGIVAAKIKGLDKNINYSKLPDFWEKSEYLAHFKELSDKVLPKDIVINDLEKIVSREIVNPVKNLFSDNIKPETQVILDAYLLSKLFNKGKHYYGYLDAKNILENKDYRSNSEEKYLKQAVQYLKKNDDSFDNFINSQTNLKRMWVNIIFETKNMGKRLSKMQRKQLYDAAQKIKSNEELRRRNFTFMDDFYKTSSALAIAGSSGFALGEGKNLEDEVDKLSDYLKIIDSRNRE